jgi:hypothetical protein
VHECGDDMMDIEKVWSAAINHGFVPLMKAWCFWILAGLLLNNDDDAKLRFSVKEGQIKLTGLLDSVSRVHIYIWTESRECGISS